MENLIPFLPYIITLIVAIPGFIALKNQLALGSADVAKKYQEIANTASIEVAKLQARVAELEAVILMLRANYAQLQIVVSHLEDWSRKLAGQVEMMGGVPVRRKEDNKL